MSNKTAMQEFLKWMGIKETDTHVIPFLEKEKQQIIDAAIYGAENEYGFEYPQAEDYYNKTYKL